MSRGLNKAEGMREPLRVSARTWERHLFVTSSSAFVVTSSPAFAIESLQWGVLLQTNGMKYLVIIPLESNVVLPSSWSQAGIGVCLLSHDCVKLNELRFLFMSFYNQRYGERLLDNSAHKFLFLTVLTSSREMYLIAHILQYNAGLVHFISVSLVQVAAIILELFLVVFAVNYFFHVIFFPSFLSWKGSFWYNSC